jgi:Rab-like protein 5
LELEKNKSSIEIWDVSGDQMYDLLTKQISKCLLINDCRYESCWPAIIKDANGVILVYNPESHVHESEAILWYEWFMQNPRIDPAQCLVFEHVTGNGKKAGGKIRLPSGIRTVATSFDSPNVFKSEFDKFVSSIQDIVQRQSRSRK